MSQVTLKNISISYDNFKALQSVNFEINQGDYLCIVGENGSGKSTLLKGMLGLVPLKSGKISFSKNLNPNEIGYLPQTNSIQKDFPASIYEVVLSGLLSKKKFFSFYTKEDKKIALENMKKLKIDHMKNLSFSSLSGGQKQRVLLARALCATKQILIIDEPTTGLDPVVTKDFYKILNDLNKKDKLTIIMTSHDIDSALKYSNKILQLKNKVLFFGSTENYKNSDICKKYIGGCC